VFGSWQLLCTTRAFMGCERTRLAPCMVANLLGHSVTRCCVEPSLQLCVLVHKHIPGYRCTVQAAHLQVGSLCFSGRMQLGFAWPSCLLVWLVM
jgi:hypothetical protein